MNKTAIKNFAVWARRRLISDITYKAGMLGISESGVAQPLSWSTQDLQFFDIGTKDYAEVSGVAVMQRNGLVNAIRAKEVGSDYKTAFRSVVEEVAYTWFNRLIAVRFMEVNDYLPSHTRVLSSESEGKLEPDFVTTPFQTDLEFSAYENDLVYQLKDENKLDELFRMLFIKQCNKLSEILPGLFEQISDYTELLLNISFTDKDGIIYHLIHDISEDEFNVEKEGQVEIIGWMYQYYNTEPKDEVFALLKKNVKITKERIPAATQLFTPDWIVRYMVENSLGRLWVEGHPNESLKGNWKYYLEEAEQEPDVIAQLKKIREEYAQLDPTAIKVIDPCMGSGHILVYAFDVLMQIYISQGYIERDAAKSILINNLYGIDIDTRAYQLAYFAVMMKARQYNRKIFSEGITPNLIAIRNPLNISKSVLKRLGGLEPLGLRLVEDFEDAEEYGSILQVDYMENDLQLLEMKLEEIDRMADYGNLLVQMESAECCNLLWPLIKQARLLSQKYDVVVTNPPYMGSNGMGSKLSGYVKKGYPDSKSDLFSVFIEKCHKFTVASGFCAMITQPSFLFLSSFEKLRYQLIKHTTIESLLHMGRGIFGVDFGSTSFVIRNQQIINRKGLYFRLHERNFKYIEPEIIKSIFLLAIRDPMAKYDFSVLDTDNDKHTDEMPLSSNRVLRLLYIKNQDVFCNIPGNPISYWVNMKIINAFENKLISEYSISNGQNITGDNNRYIRLFWEVDKDKIHSNCWAKCARGGGFRRYFGNDDNVILWTDEARNHYRKDSIARIIPDALRFKDGITWSYIASTIPSFRKLWAYELFEKAGTSIFIRHVEHLNPLLGLLNSIVAQKILALINPTFNYQVRDIFSIPVYPNVLTNSEVNAIVDENIVITKGDWDSFETSWDFKENPFIRYSRGLWDVTCTMANLSYIYGSAPKVSCPLEICWLLWQGECNERFNKLKVNEEELNRIFIDIYGLQDELTPDVADKDVTVRKADLGRDMRSFVSYAVGCMFGRYSLDKTGLVLAGQKFDSRYAHNPEGYQYGDRTMLNGDYLIDDDGSQIKCSFVPDPDNCIPITDEEYFVDDIVGRFVEFVRVVFGSEKLEENLDFVAAALGNKGNTSREVIRNYFLNDFYKDHLKIYQKRPIYWLFDSGKQNGFKALVYMHRWNVDTVGNLRIEYLHKMQTVYEHEIETCQEMIDHGSGHDVAVASRRKEKLVKQLKECKDYDALVAHIAFSKIDIDLDDGVKINYRKVQTGADGKFCEILAASKDIMAKEK